MRAHELIAAYDLANGDGFIGRSDSDTVVVWRVRDGRVYMPLDPDVMFDPTTVEVELLPADDFGPEGPMTLLDGTVRAAKRAERVLLDWVDGQPDFDDPDYLAMG